MFDSGLFGIVAAIQNVFFSHVDDDAIDRVNHCFTPLLLILFTIVSGMRQFLNPIDCWPEAEMKNDAVMNSFVDQYCWVEGTYFVEKGKVVPGPNAERPSKNNYYQWVPLFLLVQACSFQAPCLFWRLINWKSGISLNLVTELAQKSTNLDSATAEKNAAAICYHVCTVLDLHYYRKFKARSAARQWFWCCTRVFHHYGGLFLTTCYMLTKLLYCCNCVLQIYVLMRFVNEDSVLFGFNYLFSLLEGTHWLDNGHFPRVAFCDVEIRKGGGQYAHTYVLQCVLPINLIHEKLFIFLWFWYAFLLIISGLNILVWLQNTLLSRAHFRFVSKFIKLAALQCRRGRQKEKVDKKACAKFISTYLSSDGVLIFRLLEYNCGFTLTFEVLKRVWIHYKQFTVSITPSPVNLVSTGNSNFTGPLTFRNGRNGTEHATLLRSPKDEDADISAV